jgi:hypothetical protein
MIDKGLIEAMAQSICEDFYTTEWDGASPFRKNICQSMARVAFDVIQEAVPGLSDLIAGTHVVVPRDATGAMLEPYHVQTDN